jgi:CBS domain-containing protein
MRRVKDILAVKGSDIWSIGPNATVFDAIRVLAEKRIGALLVLNGDALVGVISERDYTRNVVLKNKSSRDTLVREIMTHKVITVGPNEDVHACMTLMTSRRIRHAPVIDDDGLVGVVSIGDLVRAVIEDQQSTIVDLEKYISS